jgi:hypothetical protein
MNRYTQGDLSADSGGPSTGIDSCRRSHAADSFHRCDRIEAFFDLWKTLDGSTARFDLEFA